MINSTTAISDRLGKGNGVLGVLKHKKGYMHVLEWSEVSHEH
jgi:hypothetical protein